VDFKRAPQLNKSSSFNQAPPGHSLTDEPGKWAWERPTEFSSPDEAMDALLDSLERPEMQESLIQLLSAGVSIEEITNTMTKLGFMEGKWTVDIAELLRPNLAVYLMGLAVEAGIDTFTRVFASPDGMPRTNYGLEDGQILEIMKDRNPNLYREILVNKPDRERTQRQRQAQLSEESFLGVEDVE
jgi:hypothetical protein